MRAVTARRPARLAAVAAALLLVTTAGPARAATTPVTVGALAFDLPAGLTPAPHPAAYGSGWQWAASSGPGALPSDLVLARADLAADDADEVLGLVLAGSAAGLLPGLALQPSRVRDMPGGGQETRFEVSYTAAPELPYHGALLVGTRPGRSAALLAVLGDDSLTAGDIDGVLGSARWAR